MQPRAFRLLFIQDFKSLSYGMTAALPVEPPGLACSDEEGHGAEEDKHYVARHTQPSNQAHGVVGDIVD